MVKPKHIAIIPDGNRRWSASKALSRIEGHRRGAQRMHEVVEALIQKAIPYLTVWGFSKDNWKRSDSEVNTLFHLLEMWIRKDSSWLHSRGVQLRFIGSLEELPSYLQLAILRACNLTSNNTGMNFTLAFNYSGRAEIIEATRRILEQAHPGKLDEELFSSYLYTNGMPNVDLVIRTAGEFRLSNFLLWQTAYSELYFSKVLWPDFNQKELEKALSAFSARENF